MVKYAERLDERTLKRMWLDRSVRLVEIAEHFDVSTRKVRTDARWYGLPPRKGGGPAGTTRHADPTESEIAEMCRQLREKRGEKEERPERWELPCFSYDGTHCTFSPM